MPDDQYQKIGINSPRPNMPITELNDAYESKKRECETNILNGINKEKAQAEKREADQAIAELRDPDTKRKIDEDRGLIEDANKKKKNEEASLTPGDPAKNDKTLPEKNEDVRNKQKSTAQEVGNSMAQQEAKNYEKELKRDKELRREDRNLTNYAQDPLMYIILELFLSRPPIFHYKGAKPENNLVSTIKSENRDEYNQVLQQYIDRGEVELKHKDADGGMTIARFKDEDVRKKFENATSKLAKNENLNDFINKPDDEPSNVPTPRPR